jgi:hypothetical protein
MSNITTQKLQTSFIGIGEVKGMQFNLELEHPIYYIYKVTDEGKIHYELFERKISAICIDFAKRIYSATEYKEVYPKANDFGVWAWTYSDVTDAYDKIMDLLEAAEIKELSK